jgi:hypothetical protein
MPTADGIADGLLGVALGTILLPSLSKAMRTAIKLNIPLCSTGACA